MLITVDGQSSTGKSSLAGSLASRLGFHFLGSGSLYRLVAYAQLFLSTSIEEFVSSLEEHLVFKYDLGDMRVIYRGEDLTSQINEAEVTKLASDIAKDENIRDQLGPIQHFFDRDPGLVAEGRDMGTIIFPQAKLKFFLVADVNIRAKRRHQQLQQMGMDKSLQELVALLTERDLQDENRAISPLVPAQDAVMIDASMMWDENLEQMYQHVVSQMDSNIPADLEQVFEEIKQQAELVYQEEMAGKGLGLLNWWREQKPIIDQRFGTQEIQGGNWLCPVYQRGFNYALDAKDPEMNDYHHQVLEDGTQKQIIDSHFHNQLMRIPMVAPLIPRKILQIALNIGGGLANKTVTQNYTISDFVYIK